MAWKRSGVQFPLAPLVRTAGRADTVAAVDRRLLALLSFTVIVLGVVVLAAMLWGSGTEPLDSVTTEPIAGAVETPTAATATPAPAPTPAPSPPAAIDLAFDFPDEDSEVVAEPRQAPPPPPPATLRFIAAYSLQEAA